MTDETYVPSAGGPIEAMACAVCGHVVDTRTEEVGGVEVDRTWQHTLAFTKLDADHLVVPVPVDWIRTNFVCDFCLADHARWALPVEGFQVGQLGSVGYQNEDDWAACDTCADLIRKGQWTRLTDRCHTAHVRRAGENGQLAAPRQTLVQVYEQLRRHVIGEIKLHVVKPTP